MVRRIAEKRRDGAFTVWRETAKKRMVAKLQEIKLELTYRRHEPLAVVGAKTMFRLGAVSIDGRLPTRCATAPSCRIRKNQDSRQPDIAGQTVAISQTLCDLSR